MQSVQVATKRNISAAPMPPQGDTLPVGDVYIWVNVLNEQLNVLASDVETLRQSLGHVIINPMDAKSLEPPKEEATTILGGRLLELIGNARAIHGDILNLLATISI